MEEKRESARKAGLLGLVGGIVIGAVGAVSVSRFYDSGSLGTEQVRTEQTEDTKEIALGQKNETVVEEETLVKYDREKGLSGTEWVMLPNTDIPVKSDRDIQWKENVKSGVSEGSPGDLTSARLYTAKNERDTGLEQRITQRFNAHERNWGPPMNESDSLSVEKRREILSELARMLPAWSSVLQERIDESYQDGANGNRELSFMNSRILYDFKEPFHREGTHIGAWNSHKIVARKPIEMDLVIDGESRNVKKYEVDFVRVMHHKYLARKEWTGGTVGQTEELLETHRMGLEIYKVGDKEKIDVSYIEREDIDVEEGARMHYEGGKIYYARLEPDEIADNLNEKLIDNNIRTLVYIPKLLDQERHEPVMR